jgi:hypothetical protein
MATTGDIQIQVKVTDGRIVTRCEACGQQTLFVSPSGHLTCSWLKCPAPSVDAAREYRWKSLRDEIVAWRGAIQTTPGIAVRTADEALACVLSEIDRRSQ